jgi:gluconolactonase
LSDEALSTAEPLLSLEAAHVFFESVTGAVRLDHPEGVAVDPSDGSVWCGGEAGQIYRIEPDGSSIALRAQNDGGFTLDVKFGPDGLLYHVDTGLRSVYRLDTQSGRDEAFVRGSVGGHELAIPNAIAFDGDGRMYLTDSHAFGRKGPGICRVDPDGSGELWSAGPFNFANGIAVAPDDSAVYFAESFDRCVTRIPLRADGSAGEPERYADLGAAMPDGLAFGPDELLYVGCYAPSQVLRVDESGDAVVLVRDDDVHILAHPTNLSFRGSTLFTANLGRWHITSIETDLSHVQY